MRNLERRLLLYIREHHSCTWIDVLNAFKAQKQCCTVHRTLRYLHGIRAIKISTHILDLNTTVQITGDGQHLLAEYAQRRQTVVVTFIIPTAISVANLFLSFFVY